MSNKIVIKHYPNKISIITEGTHEYKAKCLNCKNKRCIKYMNDEIQDDNVKIPISINDNVCPVDAIHCISDKIIIDSNKCIKCGLCASRCYTGAIYFKDGLFNVSEKSNGDEKKFNFATHKGKILEEDDSILNLVYQNIVMQRVDPNLLSRNLLNQCGIQTFLSRRGDVNLRMDAIIIDNNKKGVCEIEFGRDVLSCPRCVLDDLAVLCSRYDYNLEDTLALVVALGLPNNRTDYWRVIKDINDVLNIQIQTISIGMLLIAMWNFKEISICNGELYKNSDNNSLINNLNDLINRKVNIIIDENNILEPIK